MWTAEMIADEDDAALSELTEPQKRALERVTLARNMANFTDDTFVARLEHQRQIEADNRNASAQPIVVREPPVLRLVKGDSHE